METVSCLLQRQYYTLKRGDRWLRQRGILSGGQVTKGRGAVPQIFPPHVEEQKQTVEQSCSFLHTMARSAWLIFIVVLPAAEPLVYFADDGKYNDDGYDCY